MMDATTGQGRPRRLLVLCPFPQGVAAGQRLKYEQYLDDWRAAGFRVEVSSYMDLAMWARVYERGRFPGKALGVLRGHLRRLRDLVRVARYDVVYVFMWVTPFGTTLLERLVRRLSKRLIYDVEDNVFERADGPLAAGPNRAVTRFLKNPAKARLLAAEADAVIAASTHVGEACRRLNRAGRTVVIRPSVDTDRFVPAGRFSNDGPVTIGWTGTVTSRIYLDLLRRVFAELARRTRYRLRVIGNFDYELPGVDLEVVRWSREREVADLQAIDIGVYPLPRDEWALGKASLKVIQYMAMGLPSVSTAIGGNLEIVSHGVNGLLVETEREWIEALEMLIRDPELRRRIGQAARLEAVAKYSVRATASQYRDLLDGVCGAAR